MSWSSKRRKVMRCKFISAYLSGGVSAFRIWPVRSSVNSLPIGDILKSDMDTLKQDMDRILKLEGYK